MATIRGRFTSKQDQIDIDTTVNLNHPDIEAESQTANGPFLHNNSVSGCGVAQREDTWYPAIRRHDYLDAVTMASNRLPLFGGTNSRLIVVDIDPGMVVLIESIGCWGDD
ncbi:hypothetical protein K493DRAFT_308671 [Basidiobolus meristosporus CBS 931.73]|uniref:Uncharacterized protein n=1 Tax=Basidiobolus meristosporus CBS 931.73 TaxID=1314790 RepID=A0A1Y1WYJ6_9FUNG|nr:hypothetical protein K493DRAFT_308671 [Basidiobolus meristosporus CBS 931.73]|eukprot:ORX78657.1 hypothetical protein K493DRAFT_308671 [Basidiobolus meristosporus CBS 931.73]